VIWGEFKEVLCTEIGASPEQVKTVKSLLAVVRDEVHEKRKCVTMEHFNTILHVFGYFFLPKYGQKILVQMKNLLQAPYFHGNINRSKAVQLLTSNGSQDGMWLLRYREFDSNYLGSPFAISQIKNKKPIQRLIKHDPRKEKKEYIISVHGKEKTFDSLEKLILDPELNLKEPCQNIEDDIGYTYEGQLPEEDLDPSSSEMEIKKKI
jgi:hypothetical protein